MKNTANTIVGLSLVVGSAALLYMYWRKRNKDKDEVDDADGQVKLHTEIRKQFSVPNAQLPLIVGRNGATLNAIETKTNTKIHFTEKGGSTHDCEIVGEAESVAMAAILIQKEAQRPAIVTEQMEVSQNACGKIMGRCGDTLSEICRKSLAKVWIEPGNIQAAASPLSEEVKRRILITGTQGQVNCAKSLIEEQVKEEAVLREQLGNLEKREPRIRTPPSSAAGTAAEVREVLPPKQEKLQATSSDGQLEVFVSACESPSRFWVQLVGPQSTELDILVETMTDYYSQPDNQDLHRIREPYLGQVVAAAFNLDNKWYRAEVVAIQPNDFNPNEIVLDLYFVDYGDSQFARRDEVLELRADFLGLRFQAIEVFLANVVPAKAVPEKDVDMSEGGVAEWDSSANMRFDELTHVATWKKLISKIVTYRDRHSAEPHCRRNGSPVPGVELYDSQSGKDINIAKQLVLEGHARMMPKFGDLAKSHVLLVEGETAAVRTPSPPSTPSTSQSPPSPLPQTNGNVIDFLAAERSQTPTVSQRKGKHPLKDILNNSGAKTNGTAYKSHKTHNNNTSINNNHSNGGDSNHTGGGAVMKDSLNNDLMVATSWNDIVDEDQSITANQ